MSYKKIKKIIKDRISALKDKIVCSEGYTARTKELQSLEKEILAAEEYSYQKSITDNYLCLGGELDGQFVKFSSVLPPLKFMYSYTKPLRIDDEDIIKEEETHDLIKANHDEYTQCFFPTSEVILYCKKDQYECGRTVNVLAEAYSKLRDQEYMRSGKIIDINLEEE